MPNLLKQKLKILLHICCAGCGAYVSELLKKNFEVTLFFYNPNIYPEDEYSARLKETEKIANNFGLTFLVGDYNHSNWLSIIDGHQRDPERGQRCLICYHDRLETTAKTAYQKGFDYFTSTLTVSPHKLAAAIISIGNELGERYRVRFLDKDFKKQNGFKKSINWSRKLDLYRQDYCGCEFSIRPRILRGSKS